MRVHKAPVKILTIVATLVALAIFGTVAWAGRSGTGATARQAAQAKNVPPTLAEMQGKTAGQFYKNVKVLTNIPAYKLHDGMHYITAALGVGCDFCHVDGKFPSDRKRTKRTARKMMQMLFAIDKDNFHGRTKVTCYTCHRGHEKPVALPLPAESAAAPTAPAALMPLAKPIEPKAGTKIPTLQQILADYARAMGGKAALARVSTRVIEVEHSGEGRRPPVTQQIYEKAPNKVLVVTRFRGRTFRTAYNGTEAWEGAGEHARTLFGVELIVPMREAQIDPVAALGEYKGLRLTSMAQIGNRQAWVVSGLAPDHVGEQLFFDTKTGLLVRRKLTYRTVFGPLLFEADYKDYRKTHGVLIPYETSWWAGGSGWTDTVKSVKTDVPVKDMAFNPPAGKH